MALGGFFASAALEAMNTVVNNAWADRRAETDRRENYLYNEAAAQNADARTRALYNDFYSPEALMKHYTEAGLSPSMMFGGTPGQGGMGGAQGAGASGLQTPYMPMDMLKAAEAAALMSQAKKNNAEANNIDKDTELKEIQRQVNEMAAKQYKTEFDLLNWEWVDDEGKPYSLYEMAGNYKTYDEFQSYVAKKAKESGTWDEYVALMKEQGSRVLRSIYQARHQFNRDLTVLGYEEIAASFQQSVINAMNNSEFAKLNAKAAVKYLEANIETEELNKTQKAAWNNLLDKLGKSGDTWHDVIVVLGMILNNAMSNWAMPKFQSFTTNNNVNTQQ